MGFFGKFFGGTGDGGGVPPPVLIVVPSPVISPLVSTDSEFHDHAAHAINRLCQFAKRKAGS